MRLWGVHGYSIAGVLCVCFNVSIFSLLLSRYLSCCLFCVGCTVLWRIFRGPTDIGCTSVVFSPRDVRVGVPTTGCNPVTDLLSTFIAFVQVEYVARPVVRPGGGTGMVFYRPVTEPTRTVDLASPPPVTLPPLAEEEVSEGGLARGGPVACSSRLS